MKGIFTRALSARAPRAPLLSRRLPLPRFLATIQRPKSGTAPVKPSAPSNEDEFYEDDKNLDPLPVDPEKAMEEEKRIAAMLEADRKQGRIPGVNVDTSWDESVKWDEFEEPVRDGSPIEEKTFEEVFGDLNTAKEPPRQKAKYPPHIENFNNPKFDQWRQKREEDIKEKAKNIKKWEGIFKDKNSEEVVSVYTRGDAVAIHMGGFWEWIGEDFATLKFGFQQRLLNQERKLFEVTDPEEHLTNFSLSWEMPMKVLNLTVPPTKVSSIVETKLMVEVEVEHGTVPPQRFRVSLSIGGRVYQSLVRPSMNQCLKDLMDSLPEQYMIKSCWSCAYASYSPLGFSHIGGLGCFKGDPSMKNCTSGKGIFQKWQKKVEEVQEQHLCEAWEPRESPHRMPKEGDFVGKKWSYELD